MKNSKIAIAGLLLSAATLPALATVTLKFEDDATADPVKLGKYTKDISFSGNVWLLGSSQIPGFEDSLGSFYGSVGKPNDFLGNVGALLLSANPASGPAQVPPQSSFRISVTNGFNGAFSIDFAGNGFAHIEAFDSNNKRLFNGVSTPENNNGCDLPYACNWATLSFDLGGALNVAYVDVYGTDGLQWYDNISFANINAAPTDPGTLPEPGGVALSLAALGALAWTRKRIGSISKRG